ncbi:MAG: glycosyltransferase family 4 protein [Planctomycetia bacterium]|jgi:glycosyltransferase involved in cell wall biosynthesis
MNEGKKRVIAITEGPNHVCARYRIVPFGWALAERGWELTVEPIQKSLPRRLAQIAAVRHFDAVILQRKLLPIWQLLLLRRAAKRLIYDIDDALFQRDSYSSRPPESRVRLARFWTTVYAADQVLTGNDYLRQRVTNYIEPDRAVTIPTCVEPDRYQVAFEQDAPIADRSTVRAAWIGSKSTVRSLVEASELFKTVAHRVPGFRLRMICDHFPTLPGVQTESCPWSEATEATDLASADFGVSILPDDSWSRGKCGLKVLQYMAAGLPVVANPVGVHCEMIHDGQTGFLASTPAEWSAAIQRLASDPTLRHQMGRTARRTVEENYSIKKWNPLFADCVTGQHVGCVKTHLQEESLKSPTAKHLCETH